MSGGHDYGNQTSPVTSCSRRTKEEKMKRYIFVKKIGLYRERLHRSAVYGRQEFAISFVHLQVSDQPSVHTCCTWPNSKENREEDEEKKHVPRATQLERKRNKTSRLVIEDVCVCTVHST